MHSNHYALIVNEISGDSPQIAWGQCPRFPGKKNNLLGSPSKAEIVAVAKADQQTKCLFT